MVSKTSTALIGATAFTAGVGSVLLYQKYGRKVIKRRICSGMGGRPSYRRSPLSFLPRGRLWWSGLLSVLRHSPARALWTPAHC